MRERNLLKIGDNIQIDVDYTSDTDEFLILMANVHFGGRSVPLFFSMRDYPRRKNQFDQKKMESAFIKALRHILSKKYTYTIVADRGFGNSRFAQLCEENGFLFFNVFSTVVYRNDWRVCDKSKSFSKKNFSYTRGRDLSIFRLGYSIYQHFFSKISSILGQILQKFIL